MHDCNVCILFHETVTVDGMMNNDFSAYCLLAMLYYRAPHSSSKHMLELSLSRHDFSLSCLPQNKLMHV